MSRSVRKTPKRGMCGSRHHISEKDDKRRFNRKMRRKNKVLTVRAADEDVVFKHKDEIEDVWGFSKDGKIWLGKKIDPKEMRK